MNCANHPEAPAVGYCRTCGKPLCSTCARDVRGVIYCEECLASHLSGAVPPPGMVAMPLVVEPAPGTPSPKLAAILGCIPGVGAMYNGEFAKGFVHVLIFASLIGLASNVNGGLAAVVGMAIAAFYIYMPIEAYKTARAKQMGLPAPDPFGFNTMFSSTPKPTPNSAPVAAAPVAGAQPGLPYVAPDMPLPPEPRSRVPLGAIVLIGLGVLFLLNEMNLLNFDRVLERFWPLILIALGVRVLMQRQRRGY
jgi:hypothetical protein